MISFAVRLENVDAIKSMFRRSHIRGAENMEAGIMAAARFLMMKSQQLVPVDTARLARSARITKYRSGFVTEVEVSYDTPYAVFVHEDLTKYHKPPTQAKFLEQPARMYAGEIAAIVASQKGWRAGMRRAVFAEVETPLMEMAV